LAEYYRRRPRPQEFHSRQVLSLCRTVERAGAIILGKTNSPSLGFRGTCACLPVDNADDGDTKGPSRIKGEDVDPLIGWCLTDLVNFTGHPTASIPSGLSDDNLPVGMQIIGRRYADTDVLAASAALERLRTYRSSARRSL
jgi:amidase/aspartyl-tRNA(Asn)/glutamyl-tRNA(Gln) amidotransferase subunit A